MAYYTKGGSIDDDGLTPQERVSIMDEKEFENLRLRERKEDMEKRERNKVIEIACNLAEGVNPAIIAKTTGILPEDLVCQANPDGVEYTVHCHNLRFCIAFPNGMNRREATLSQKKSIRKTAQPLSC